MVSLLTTERFKSMPWKNGKGMTQQIYIFPENETVEKNNFDFRISSAPVLADSEFSLFPNKARFLIPIKGAGFALNNDIFEKFEVAHFSGEKKVFCTLLKDSVLDYGIIYNPLKCHVSIKILQLKTNLTLNLDTDGDYFLSLLSGNFSFKNTSLKELETIHLQNEKDISLEITKSATVAFVKLKKF